MRWSERSAKDVSTPQPRNALKQACPRSLIGKAVTNRDSIPHCANETATFASPPPKHASKLVACKIRVLPGGESRNITSPNVTTLMTRTRCLRPRRSASRPPSRTSPPENTDKRPPNQHLRDHQASPSASYQELSVF